MPIIKKRYALRTTLKGGTEREEVETRRGGKGRKKSDILEGSGREGCGSTHCDRLNSRAPDSFSFQVVSLPLRLGWMSSSGFHLPLIAFLFSTPSPLSISFSLSFSLSVSRSWPPLYCSSITAGSPLTANHHFQFSVVERLHRLPLFFSSFCLWFLSSFLLSWIRGP